MAESQEITHPKMKQTEEIFQTLKNRILLYANLYLPDFIVYDLAKVIEEFYEEDRYLE